jgi:tetratricopeptide (TPR) repeat protein
MLMGLVLVLIASPAWAQTDDETVCNTLASTPGMKGYATQDELISATIAACTTAIETGHKTKKELAFLYNSRGEAYGQQSENQKQEIADFTKAISLDPNEAAFYFNRSLNEGNHKKAVADLRKALKLAPNDQNIKDELDRRLGRIP